MPPLRILFYYCNINAVEFVNYMPSLYTNLNLFGINSLSEINGKRPGGVIDCVHSNENEGGCGTSKACQYCNLVNLVLKSIKSNATINGEILLTATINGHELPLNLPGNVSPFEMEGEIFYIVSLIDISGEKRKT